MTVVRSHVLGASARESKWRIGLVDPRLQSRHLIFLRQDLSLPLVGRALLRQALLRRTMFSGGAARVRSRLCLGGLLVRVRVFRKILVRNHSWLCRRCILGILFLPVRARNIAKRLSVGGRTHQQRDCKNLQEYSLHNPPSRLVLNSTFNY